MISAYELILDVNKEAAAVLLEDDECTDKFHALKRSFVLEQIVDLLAEIFPAVTEETSLSEAIKLTKKIVGAIREMEGLFDYAKDDTGKDFFESVFGDEA